MQRAQWAGQLSVLLTIKLLKERDQRGGIFHRKLGAAGNFLHHSFVSLGAGGCADEWTRGRGAPNSRLLSRLCGRWFFGCHRLDDWLAGAFLGGFLCWFIGACSSGRVLAGGRHDHRDGYGDRRKDTHQGCLLASRPVLSACLMMVRFNCSSLN